MKEIKTSRGLFLAIEVPKYHQYLISYLQGDPDLIGFDDNGSRFIVTLPEYCCERTKTEIINKAEILFLASQATEDQAKHVVEVIETVGEKNYYRDYNVGMPLSIGDGALQSFHSLLEANDLWVRNPLGKHPTSENYAHHQRSKMFKDISEWHLAHRRLKEYIILKVK